MNEKNTELLKIVKENPELSIMFFTHYEVVCDDSSSYWGGELESVRVDYIWSVNDRNYIGEEEIKDELRDNLADDNQELSDDDYDNLVDETFEKMLKDKEVTEHIIVRIGI